MQVSGLQIGNIGNKAISPNKNSCTFVFFFKQIQYRTQKVSMFEIINISDLDLKKIIQIRYIVNTHVKMLYDSTYKDYANK